MRCPNCEAAYDRIRVVLTTYTNQKEIVRRRRCLKCDHRWYTLQLPERPLGEDAIEWKHRGSVTLLNRDLLLSNQ